MNGIREKSPKVAIVDYHMGNLFSVRRACEIAGLDGVVTSDVQQIRVSDAVILPGVGAFGNAMATLHELGLVDALREFAASGKPFVGICLGAQLLLTESQEFGFHKGLNLLEGAVVRLEASEDGGHRAKVPNVGWRPVQEAGTWDGTLLSGISDGTYMYFVHSYRMMPADPVVTVATTRFGQKEFCSALCRGNIFGCQFHPERSGEHGLLMYKNLADDLGVNRR